jgi:hypothetical protein
VSILKAFALIDADKDGVITQADAELLPGGRGREALYDLDTEGGFLGLGDFVAIMCADEPEVM